MTSLKGGLYVVQNCKIENVIQGGNRKFGFMLKTATGIRNTRLKFLAGLEVIPDGELLLDSDSVSMPFYDNKGATRTVSEAFFKATDRPKFQVLDNMLPTAVGETSGFGVYVSFPINAVWAYQSDPGGGVTIYPLARAQWKIQFAGKAAFKNNTPTYVELPALAGGLEAKIEESAPFERSNVRPEKLSGPIANDAPPQWFVL